MARLDTSSNLEPFDQLGGYQLLLTIGVGGMGRVWAARRANAPNSPLVALKTTLEEMAGDKEFERVFVDEARIASSIVHPNVCGIHELGAENGVAYLVMEWIEGGSLHDVLSASPNRRIAPFVAARILCNMCDGLHAAHELIGPDGEPLGVVHRDVSPQNVLISAQGHVKVADFGVARARGQLHKPTETGELKGKLSYMAPEQLTTKDFDRRADVFALGCVLYEATTGSRPFHGGDALETMYKLLETNCARPLDLLPDYPPDLEAIVLKALEKEPTKRYQSAEALCSELEQFLSTHRALVTDRDIAELVASTLGERIDARRAELNQAIVDADELAANPGQRRAPPTLTLPSGEVVPGAQTPASTWTEVSATSDRHRRWLWPTVVAAFVLIGVGSWLTRPRHRAESASVGPEIGAEKPGPSATKSIVLTLRGTPSTTRFQVDDGPWLTNPHVLSTPAEAKQHVIRAMLEGYQTETRVVTFEQSQSIEFALQLSSTAPTSAPATTATGHRALGKATAGPAGAATVPGTGPRRPRRNLDPSNPFDNP